MHESTDMIGFFWDGTEVVKASFTLIYCTYSLYGLFSWGCFVPFFIVAAKMGLDISTREWREGTFKKHS
jgi:hypothetical protein